MRQITIGRLTSNNVCLNDKSVSRNHCILTVHSDGRCELTDCNSTNGTFVNGNRIRGTVMLRPNDYVRVGNQQLPWRNYIYGNGVFEGTVGSGNSGGSNQSGGAVNTTGSPRNANGLIWGVVGGLVLVTITLVLSLTGVFKGSNPSYDPMTDPMLNDGGSGVRTNVPGAQNGGSNTNGTTTTSYTDGNSTTTVISSPGETMTIVDTKTRQTFEGHWVFQNECYVFELNLNQQGDQLYGSYSYADNRAYMDDEPDNSIRGSVSGNTATVRFHSAARGGGGKATMTLQSDGTLKWKFKEADDDNQYLFDYIVPDLSILKKKK